MNYLFILAILIVGLSGLVTQALMLRELLVSFYGSELTLSIVLANWVLLEALGAFIMAKFSDKNRNKTNIFIILEIIFSSMLPVSIYLARAFKGILGLVPGEAIGLNTVFLSSFFIILPLGFCHGALFTISLSLLNKGKSRIVGKVYALETIGTIIGGLILTYIFIPFLSSLKISFVISIINILICFFITLFLPKTKLRYLLLPCIFLSFYLFLSPTLRYLERVSIQQQLRQGQVLEYRNSVYGNIAVTKQSGQYTFFYNGLPITTIPHPDITFVEEFGNLPLLFHPAPKDILILSQGAGGLINELLKHPVTKLDYLELDPLIIEMLKKYSTSLTQAELTDKRVNIINLDSRFYLKNTRKSYDIVLIGLSSPADLTTNRLFTKEFFLLVKERLRPDGILALWLPGSLTYLNQELKDLNMCILNGLRQVYKHTRIIPGDYNIFLVSNSESILKVTAGQILERITQQNIKSNILTPNYLAYRLNKYWLDWFVKASNGATKKINQDLRPIAVFEMGLFWNKKVSAGLTGILEFFQGLELKIAAIFIFLITLLLYFLYCIRRVKVGILYSIFTTGFFGMLSNLLLIFSFQIFYGYLYHKIGLLLSIFMAGIAVGSIFMTGILKRLKSDLKLFIGLEALLILFLGAMSLGISRFFEFKSYGLIFIGLFFISGLFLGLEFPLASKIYLGKKQEVAGAAGGLYAADLIGGWLAGVFGGVILLPVLGLFNSCLVIIIFKISSLLLLLATKSHT